jgi:hypothetical protein
VLLCQDQKWLQMGHTLESSLKSKKRSRSWQISFFTDGS